MIDYIKLTFAVAVPLLIGYMLIAVVSPRKDSVSSLEKFGVSFPLGAGVLTLTMFLLAAFGIKLSLGNIMIALSVVMAYPAFAAFKKGWFALNKRPDLRLDKLKWYEALFVSLIFARILFVLYELMIKPVVGCDAFANWSLKAKVFYVLGDLAVDKGRYYQLGGGPAFYPLNIPLLETWMFNVLGYWNDLLIKIIFFMLFISLLSVFYAALRKCCSRQVSLLSTYMLTTLPLLLHHATIEYADFPLCVYFSCAAILLIRYFEDNDNGLLVLSSMLAGIGSWTKSEGTQMFMICAFVLCLYYFRKKQIDKLLNPLLLYILLALTFKVPWSLFNIYHHIAKNAFQKIEWTKVFEYNYKIPVIFSQFYQKMFLYGNWNIAWFVFIVLLVISFKKLNNLRTFYSLAFVFLCLMAYVFIYYLTLNYQWLLDGTSFNRNMLIMMPVLIFAVSSMINEVFPAEKGKC